MTIIIEKTDEKMMEQKMMALNNAAFSFFPTQYHLRNNKGFSLSRPDLREQMLVIEGLELGSPCHVNAGVILSFREHVMDEGSHDRTSERRVCL